MKFKFIILGIIVIVIILIITNKDNVEKMIKGATKSLDEIATDICLNFWDFISSYSLEFGVSDVKSIIAVIIKESSGVVDPLPHKAGDGVGLMQITKNTAKDYGFTGSYPNDIIPPITNLYYGIKIWADCMDKENNVPADAYGHYNGGAGWRTTYAENRAGIRGHIEGYMNIYNQLI